MHYHVHTGSFLPNPAISSTPMYVWDEVNGKHWLTLLTMWSNIFMYNALASASLALVAWSFFSGTLGDQ